MPYVQHGRVNCPLTHTTNSIHKKEDISLIRVTRKWWLGPLLLFLVPLSFALQPGSHEPDRNKCKHGTNCQKVPEGGSAALYLLGASLICLGAVFVHSRASRPAVS
jgi:hypothetical protein